MPKKYYYKFIYYKIFSVGYVSKQGAGHSSNKIMFHSLFSVYNIVYSAENMFFADNFDKINNNQILIRINNKYR